MEKKTKVMVTLAVIIVLTLICIFLDLSWASSSKSYSFQEVWAALFGQGSWASQMIIRDINLPRVVAGLVIGAGLAVCGAAMQAIFRNPLASPYILGLSSGASVGAVLSMLIPITFIPLVLVTPVLAFITCFATMAVVYSMARVGGSVRTETLILSGVAVSALLSAIVSFLTFISGDQLAGVVFWTMGSLGSITWEMLAFITPVILAASIILILQAKSLNAMMLGDIHAMDLGVDVRNVRLLVIILTTVIVAAAVSFAGVIGFIGLVIPHIIRILLGPDNRIVLPMSIITGGCFLVICDYLTHIVASQYGVLPIGVVTALIGAPVFIYLLIRKKKEVGWN